MTVSPPQVVIASFRSVAEAQIARAAIEEAGIDVAVAVEQSLGIGVSVSATDADRAVAILRDLWPESHETAADDGQSEPERCPECGSSVFLRIRRLPFFLGFTALMLTLGVATDQRDLFTLMIGIVAALLFVGPNRRCLDCGERWRGWKSAPPPPEEPPVEPPDVVCPRCGSLETGMIDRRRMKASTLLLNFILPPLLLVWPFMARRKCDECGHEWR